MRLGWVLGIKREREGGLDGWVGGNRERSAADACRAGGRRVCVLTATQDERDFHEYECMNEYGTSMGESTLYIWYAMYIQRFVCVKH